MKTLFKKADRKFAEIGLVKIKENEDVVAYERRNNSLYNRLIIVIDHKPGEKHFIKIFDWEVYSTEEGRITHEIAACATPYELKLILRKMKEKGWISK